MNSEDKLVDEKAKTYVSAGDEKKGNSHTAGQAKAEVHERMPEEDAEEPTDRIAAGIEIDGSNIEKELKESYTKTELKKFVLSEAAKAVKSYKNNSRIEGLKNELKIVAESIKENGGEVNEKINQILQK